MVSDELIKEGAFDVITAKTKEAVQTMLGFEMKHVGININSKNEASTLASQLKNMFGFEQTNAPGNVGYFSGTGIELLYEEASFTGEKGHLAIMTNSIERAKFHLEMQGVTFNEESARYNENGICSFLYLNGIYGGFTIHLSLKK